MEAFNEGLSLIQKAIGTVGIFNVVWGLYIIGGAWKEKTGPDMTKGIGWLVGGVFILAAAYLVTYIKW